MRAIDADAFRQRMYHEAFETDTDMQRWDSGCWIRYKLFENCIDEQPTLSPDEVRGVGKWVEDRTEIYCPVCGQRFTDEVMCCGIYGWPWYFCPKCGNKVGRSVDNDSN